MDAVLAPPFHRFALVTHAILAVWLLGNGVAHQIGVLVGAWRGTLRSGADVDALLAVGAGLLLAGALVSWSIAGLSRGATTFAMVSVGVLALVVLAIAAKYGWGFLGGTSVIGVVDLVALSGFALLGSVR
jgi:hypothetical protein